MTARARSCGQCLRGVGVSVLLILGGCGTSMADDAGDEAGAALGAREDAIRIPNSLTTQALVFNALTTNRTANQMLGATSLTALFSSPGSTYIQNQLQDPNAQQLMYYLVGCALGSSQTLPWTNPLMGNSEELWHGALGLCPEWATQPPSQGCLERVSSCLIARNNAFGRRVELSLRGEHPTDPTVYRLEPQTRPTEYDPSTSLHQASFNACTSTTMGAARDCGWAVDYIGSCTPGASVRLGAGGRAPDLCSGSALGSTSSGRLVLRACEGIAGCDNESTRMLAQSEGSCSGTAPAMTFTCPGTGYFSVMTAPYKSTLSSTGVVQVAAPSNYPLSESDVFRVREGAYYGTIFDPNALATEVTVSNGRVYGADQTIKGAVYRKMYSCYDSGWSNGAAMATYRVCALPSTGANCAAKVSGECVNSAHLAFPSSMCATGDGSQVEGDGDYESCRDTSSSVLWTQPITVFLNGPCDVVSGGDKPSVCQRK